MTFQTEKQVVRDFYGALENAGDSELDGIMNQFCAPDLLWRGFHPFNEIRGCTEAVSYTHLTLPTTERV